MTLCQDNETATDVSKSSQRVHSFHSWVLVCKNPHVVLFIYTTFGFFFCRIWICHILFERMSIKWRPNQHLVVAERNKKIYIGNSALYCGCWDLLPVFEQQTKTNGEKIFKARPHLWLLQLDWCNSIDRLESLLQPRQAFAFEEWHLY